jgi:hypothetical protein
MISSCGDRFTTICAERRTNVVCGRPELRQDPAGYFAGIHLWETGRLTATPHCWSAIAASFDVDFLHAESEMFLRLSFLCFLGALPCQLHPPSRTATYDVRANFKT